MSHLSPDHILFVFSVVIPCTVLMGVWAVYDGIRIGGLVKRGEA